MEVITGLVLILLGATGARNIPLHEDAPSELPLEFANVDSYTKTSLATIFTNGELVESVVNKNQELHLNKNADEDEIVKHHGYNEVSLETDGKGSMDNQEERKEDQEEKVDNVLKPVEVIIEVQNNEKIEKHFEDRSSFVGECPTGTFRLGCCCVVEDKDS